MRRNTASQKIILALLIAIAILLAIVSALLYLLLQQGQGAQAGGSTPAASFTPPASAQVSNDHPLVQLAWFTNVPRADDLPAVSQRFDLFILIQGGESKRNAMIDYGAKGPFLQYLEFESIQDPGSCAEEPEANQVTAFAGDFCQISSNHPDWFLLDTSGNRIRITDNGNIWYLMDPGNAEWRAFYLERIRQFQTAFAWSGVFLDNVPLTLAFREDDGKIPAKYQDDASYRNAIQGFLEYLYDGYFRPNGKLLFANLVSRRDSANWAAYLGVLDGAMYEGWAIDWPNGYRPPAEWETQMTIADQTQEMGKYIILVSQGEKDDLALQKFALASYLLVNHGQAYFRYAHSSSYREVWLYDDYSYNLGRPLAPRYKDGPFWKRDFTNGSVAVNPTTHEVEIILK